MPPAQEPRPQLAKTIYANMIGQLRVCPDCAGPIVHNSGCVHCAQCGWARCG